MDLTYRIWLIKNLAKLFFPPIAIVRLLLRDKNDVGFWIRAGCYIFSLPVYWTAWVWYTRWDEERRARARGAKLPPIVQGSKLGNIDVLKRWVDVVHDEKGGNVY